MSILGNFKEKLIVRKVCHRTKYRQTDTQTDTQADRQRHTHSMCIQHTQQTHTANTHTAHTHSTHTRQAGRQAGKLVGLQANRVCGGSF